MALTDLIAGLPAVPPANASEFGEVEVVPLSRTQKLSSSFLHRNWIAIPHVTHHDEADVTDLEARRRAFNAANPDSKLTAPVLVAKALVDALRTFPQFNASLDSTGQNLLLKKYFNIGFAVETPRGLLIAVVRDCDTKPATVIAAELAALAAKARAKGLALAEMSGGCMTISSLGHIGGVGFTPIINAPEVAILGLTRARPVATPAPDQSVAWRTMLPLSLSYDHRAIDGADAARFTRFVADRLQQEDIFG